MPIQANQIYFSYSDEEDLFQGLEIRLGEKSKIALTGPNGSGKTTLLKILSRGIEPTSGNIFGEKAPYFLGQHLFDSQSTVSGGEIRLARLRTAFESESKLLLLDEPTNDLDPDARRWLIDAIKRFQGALLIVSHDPEILDSIDEIYELRNGKIVHHPPGFRAYFERLNLEEAALKAEMENIQSESKKAEVQARKVIQTQQKRIARGQKKGVESNLPKIIRGMKKRQAQNTLAKLSHVHGDRTEEFRERAERARKRLREISSFEWDRSRNRPPKGKRLLEIKNANLPGNTSKLNYEMKGPRKLHLKGRNGSGKSTLLRALAGEEEALCRVGGEFFLATPFKLFDQGLTQFISKQPLWVWFQEQTGYEVALARTLLGRLGFEQEEQERPVSALSGGERVRLEMALAVNGAEPPEVLLLDEPTNHLDLESRRILQSFIKDFEGGLVVVSHDRVFLAEIRFDDEIDLDGVL